MPGSPVLEWIYYKAPGGACPLDEFLASQDPDCRAFLVAKMEYFATMGISAAGQKGKVEKLKGDIQEVKIRYRDRQFRVLFSLEGQIMLALLGFAKTTPKTPSQHIETANDRLAAWRARGKTT